MSKKLKTFILMVGVLFFCCVTVSALAASFSATIEADNGTIDFTSGGTANLSYSSTSSNIYTVTIEPSDMSTSASAGSKVLTITLMPGMRWVDDASSDTNVTNLLSGSVVEGSGTTVGSYTLGDGTRTYTFIQEADTVSVQIKIAMDEQVWSDVLEGDVILTAEYEENGSAYAAELKAGTIDNLDSVCVKRDSVAEVILLNEDVEFDPASLVTTSNRTKFYLGPDYSTYVSRLITKAVFTVKVSDANAVLALNTASAEPETGWSVVDNDNGTYTFTWSSKDPVKLGEFLNFFTFEFPSTDEGGSDIDWQPGDQATVTYESIDLTFYDPIETTYTYNTEIDLYDNAALVFQIPKEEEYVYVNWHGENIAEVDSTSKDRTESYYTTTGTYGTLGAYFVGNAGGVDSANKIITLTFNSTDIGVRGVYIPLVEGAYLQNGGIVYIKTNLNSTVRAVDCSSEVGASLGYEGNGTIYLSEDELGLLDGEYLTGIVCYIGSIPATTSLGNGWEPNYINIIGDRLTDTATVLIGTVEITDEDGGNSTGAGNIYTEFSYNPTPNVTSMGATQTISAGETFTNCSVVIENNDRWVNDSQTLDDPIIYLRALFEDGAGGYLEYTNIKITNVFGTDITDDCTITRTTTDSGYLYTIDTSAVPDFGARLYPYTSLSDAGKEQNKNQLTVTWDIETSAVTPTQSVNYRSIVRIASPHADCAEGYSTVLASNFTESTYAAVRPANSYTQYLSIKGSQYILVATTAKHENGVEWQNWEPDVNPVAIGFGLNTSFLIKTTITNNSGTEINTTTQVYIPIPKYGDDWGDLLYDDDGDKKLDFGISLTGPIQDVDSSGYTFEYCVVENPTADGQTLEALTWYTYEQLLDAGIDIADVNCVRITADKMNVDEVNNFIMDCKVYTDQPVTLTDGMTDVWRPLYYQSVATEDSEGNKLTYSGWYKGEYIGIETALGELTGQVFYDADSDGQFTAGVDSYITDAIWKITAYDDQGTAVQVIYTTDDYDETGSATGEYHFYDLLQDEDFYTITAEPVSGNAYEAAEYTVTLLGTLGTLNSWNTDNQFTISSGTAGTSGAATAKMPENTGEETPAVYNLGITDDAAIASIPVVEKTITGDTPSTEETFTFKLQARSYVGSAGLTAATMPMPSGSSGGVKTITVTGEGTASFGVYIYKEEGTYLYTVSEVTGSNSGYEYDTLVYTIKDTVYDNDGTITYDRVIVRSDDVARSDVKDNLTFENVYSDVVADIVLYPQTGDESKPIVLWIALIGLSLAAGGWILYHRRRSMKNRA